MEKTPVRAVFVANSIISNDHLNVLGSAFYELVTRSLLAQYEEFSGGVVLSPDSFRIRIEEGSPENQIPAKLFVGNGLAVIRGNTLPPQVIVLTQEIEVAIPTGLTEGHSYIIYLKYRQTEDDPAQFNPITGDTTKTLRVSVVDGTSSTTCTDDVSFIFTESECAGTEYIRIGKIFYEDAYQVSLVDNHKPIAVPKIYWADSDPDGLLKGHTPSPTVQPYSNILDFLACKGSAPRTTTNPFGLSLEDLGGRREYWEYVAGSSIIQTVYDSDRTSLRVSYPSATYPEYVVVEPLEDTDYAVVGGQRLSPDAVIANMVEVAGERRVLFPNSYTNQASSEVWVLALRYNETHSRFEAVWVSGTADSPVFNEPFLYTDSPNTDWVGYFPYDSGNQILIGDAKNNLETFLRSPDYLVLAVIGRHYDGTGYKTGVWYTNPLAGIMFNESGEPGDYRVFGFVASDNVRYGYPSDSADSQSDYRLSLQTTVGEVLRDHLTKPYGDAYKHRASDIERAPGYSYIYNQNDERDVDSALNAIVQAIGEIDVADAVTVYIEPTGDLNQDTSAFENALSVLSSQNGHGIIAIRPNGNTFLTKNSFSTNVSVGRDKTLVLVIVGVNWKAENNSSPINLTNITGFGKLVILHSFPEEEQSSPSAPLRFGAISSLSVIGTSTPSEGDAVPQVELYISPGASHDYKQIEIRNTCAILKDFVWGDNHSLRIVDSVIEVYVDSSKTTSQNCSNVHISGSVLKVVGSLDSSTDYELIAVGQKLVITDTQFTFSLGSPNSFALFKVDPTTSQVTIDSVSSELGQDKALLRVYEPSSSTYPPINLSRSTEVQVLATGDPAYTNKIYVNIGGCFNCKISQIGELPSGTVVVVGSGNIDVPSSFSILPTDPASLNFGPITQS